MTTAFATNHWHDVTLPLADEPFASAWRGYAATAAREGTESVLRRFVQLRFPIAAGTSATDEYQAAVRRGVVRHDAGMIELRRPNAIRIRLQPTAAGSIPVLIIPERDDFVSLVQAFVHRNEPVTISPAMGACVVAGYNNWDRVAALRSYAEFETGGASLSEENWLRRWRALMPRKELYQDRFIMLSTGPYSAVDATALGLSSIEWLRLSLTIRLEHECAHYFTRRVFGAMRNSLHDELLADYAGIVAACGRYRADWFLHFMGLDAYPRYRKGARLENYGDGAAPDSAASIALQQRINDAAWQLEAFDAQLPLAARPMLGRAAVLAAIADCSLDQLAASDGASRLRDAYERMRTALT
ncbi:MAG: hypothetical protein ABI664_01575 [bacterium]